jgi:hypothetical protein
VEVPWYTLVEAQFTEGVKDIYIYR